jgi:hypothetical protein
VKYQYGSTYHMERVKDCKKTITDKWSLQAMHCHDHHKESKRRRPHLRSLATEERRMQSKLDPDSVGYKKTDIDVCAWQCS